MHSVPASIKTYHLNLTVNERQKVCKETEGNEFHRTPILILLDVSLIIMFGPVQKKCYQYWPEEEGDEETYGPVTVSSTHVERRDNFYIRTFAIRRQAVKCMSLFSVCERYMFAIWVCDLESAKPSL